MFVACWCWRVLLCWNGFNLLLSSHQVDASEPQKAADVILKIGSLYSEDPETKAAVLDTIGE